jgi:predicted ATPase
MKRGEGLVQGTSRKKPISLGLGFVGSQFSYSIDLGLPPPDRSNTPTAFSLDPIIKGEFVWVGPIPRPSAMLVERRGGLVRTRGEDGEWQNVHERLAGFDSMLSQMADPRRTPELSALREQIRSWRFYDLSITVCGASACTNRYAPRCSVTTVLTWLLPCQTIREIGAQALDEAVHDAFPGASVAVETRDGRFEQRCRSTVCARSMPSSCPMAPSAICCGSRHTIPSSPGCWCSTNRKPAYPDLLPALGRLMGKGGSELAIFVVSHAGG